MEKNRCAGYFCCLCKFCRLRRFWEFSQADPPANIVLHNLQTANCRANGNTVVFSSTAGNRRDGRPEIIQAVEVTAAGYYKVGRILAPRPPRDFPTIQSRQRNVAVCS